jgi:GNAT superfamily N-acetyltransferase
MIRAARPTETEALGALAFRSKAHWGYSAAFMAACRAELSVSADDLDRCPTWVLVEGGMPVGFYSLEPLGEGRVELAHLFVEPTAIGRGHGRRLMEHARAEARRRGWVTLLIQGDPHAAGFYEACGAVCVGSSPSASIPGRSLPLFELALDV